MFRLCKFSHSPVSRWLWRLYSGWHLNDVQLVLLVPNCAKKISDSLYSNVPFHKNIWEIPQPAVCISFFFFGTTHLTIGTYNVFWWDQGMKVIWGQTVFRNHIWNTDAKQMIWKNSVSPSCIPPLSVAVSEPGGVCLVAGREFALSSGQIPLQFYRSSCQSLP